MLTSQLGVCRSQSPIAIEADEASADAGSGGGVTSAAGGATGGGLGGEARGGSGGGQKPGSGGDSTALDASK
jgi:hypothetical protein